MNTDDFDLDGGGDEDNAPEVLEPEAPEADAEPDQEPGEVESKSDEGDEPDLDGKPDNEPAQKQETVPHKRFHAERERRKSAEAQAAELQRQFEVGNQRLQMIMDMQQKLRQPQQPEAVPDRYEDPEGYERYQAERIDRLESVAQTYEQQQQQAVLAQQQQAQWDQYREQIVSSYAQDAEAFASEEPSFKEANEYLVNAQLQIAQLRGDQDPVNSQMQDEFRLVEAATRAGKSPAEAIFNAAKAMGFKSSKNDDTVVGEAEAKLDKIEAGQKASRSLSGGSTPSGAPTLKTISKMSDADWTAWYEKHGDEGLMNL